MCGILGVVSDTLSEDKFKNVLDSLEHRGPDDSGVTCFDNKVFLGNRRLTVIDLSPLGRQPMSNKNGSVWIAYNGEIYNHRQLRKELEKKGYDFKSQTDTEVILHLYEEKGEECLKDLNGMFAFAIYDKKKQHLFLARDRLGIKPLYYAVYNNQLIFASEIKAILAANIIPKEINWQAIYDYFSFLYIPCPDTAFCRIKQVPPAHYLLYDLNQKKLSLKSYWDPYIGNNGYSNSSSSYDELKDELVFLLEDSVKGQLISDVPLGLFLSGGIDSSILAALATKHSTTKLKTFTVTFHGEEVKSYDEREYARRVSEFLDTDHQEVDIKLTNPNEVLELIDCFDQPFANPTSYLSYLISKETKKQVTVALSGAGGDELFGGYPRYKVLGCSKNMSLVPKGLSRSVNNAMLNIPENSFGSSTRRLKLLLRGLGEELPEQYLRWTYYLSDEEKSSLLKPLLGKNGPLRLSTDVIKKHLHDTCRKDLLNDIQYIDIKTFLLDNVLEYTDKTSMAVSLETRVPYLDHRIVELSFKIPQKFKLNWLNTKLILKDTFKHFLPAQIFNAPKRGFCAPISHWIENHFDYYFEQILTANYIEKQGILNWDYMQRLRNYHKLKKEDNSMELFGIIMFDVWYRKYFSN